MSLRLVNKITLVERLTCERHSEEVESIPSPAEEAAKEHAPLMFVELFEDGPRIVELCTRWFQRREPRWKVSSDLWGE